MVTVNFVYFYSMKNNNLIQCHLKQDVKVICSLNNVSRLALMREKGSATLNMDERCLLPFVILVISKRANYSYLACGGLGVL